MLLYFVSSDFEMRLEETQVNEEKWQARYIVSHPIKHQVQRQRCQRRGAWVCLNESRPILTAYVHCTCTCTCLCLAPQRKGSHRANRVEINKDKSSIFSLSDRWFMQKQLRSVIEQPQETQQTKQCLTPASCSHVWDSVHMLLENEAGEVTFYVQFALTFHISIRYFTFSQRPVLSCCVV